jgi:hypothetical protein
LHARVERAKERGLEDRRASRPRHRGIRSAIGIAGIRPCYITLRGAQLAIGVIQAAVQPIGTIEHAASVTPNCDEGATAMLGKCERRTMSPTMTAFCYGFGLAIAAALTIAIGNAWAREHRNGVWTMNMLATAFAVAITFGLVVGWALQQYFILVAASATGRM